MKLFNILAIGLANTISFSGKARTMHLSNILVASLLASLVNRSMAQCSCPDRTTAKLDQNSFFYPNNTLPGTTLCSSANAAMCADSAYLVGFTTGCCVCACDTGKILTSNSEQQFVIGVNSKYKCSIAVSRFCASDQMSFYSTNFKTDCCVASAPPTGAPTAAPNAVSNWYLERHGGVQWSAFDALGQLNISMVYNVSKTASYTVNLKKSNCIDPVDSTVAWPVNQLYPYGAPSQYNGLRVDALIDEAKVANSPIWTAFAINNTARIDLCARVDLTDTASGTSYNFHEQKLSVTIDLTQGFTVTGVGVGREAATEVATTSSVNAGLSVCKCGETAVCSDTTPLVQGDALFICISSTVAGVRVASVQNLTLVQASTPVYNSSVIAGGLSTNTVTSLGFVGTTAVVQTQLPSGLFTPSNVGVPLTGSGRVLISIGDGRVRSLRFAIDNSVDDLGSSVSRKMQDQTNETQTGFSFTINLAPREMEEAPQAADNTALFIGVIIGAIAGVAIIVAVVLATRRKKEYDKAVETKSVSQSIN
jgi:hypothetical protein